MILSPQPRLHFSDANGKPLANGTLSTYTGSSSNPIQTYADYAGTILNPVNINLDSRGECQVFLNPNIVYIFVLKDSNGVEIYTVNGVHSSGSTSNSNVSLTSTDNTVTITNTIATDGSIVYNLSIQNQIDSLNASISNEANARATADSILNSNLSNETTSRINSDNILQNEIDAKTVNVTAPITKSTGSDGQPVIGHQLSGVTPGTYGDNGGNRTLNWGDSFNVVKGSVDSTGHINSASSVTISLPESNTGNYIGSFLPGILSNTATQSSVTKISGTILGGINSIPLPTGTYHVVLKCAVTGGTPGANTEDANITVTAKITDTLFDTFKFKVDANSGRVQYFDHAFDITISSESGSLTIWTSYESGVGQAWSMTGSIYLHSVGIAVGGLGEVSHDSTLTGKGNSTDPLGISNPLWYIKGNTDWGGTITTNLNTIIHSGFYTATGSATGVPNSSYSWFILHQNSNAGILYAQQTAYAYTSGSIICYERLKINNVWNAWSLRSGGVDDHKLLVSSTDTAPGFLFDKVESTTLTINYSVDNNGVQKLDMNVVNTASGYPNNYEPFFPSGSFTKLGNEIYSGISSPNLTRGFFFTAPRSMTVANLGIYLKGEPSPSGGLQIELAIKDCINNIIQKTNLLTVNTANFPSLSSGGVYSVPLTTAMSVTGTNPYVLYLMLKSSDGTTQLSQFSNLQFMEICDRSSESIQMEAGVYSQYSSQNFEGYGDTGYSNIACRPYSFISE